MERVYSKLKFCGEKKNQKMCLLLQGAEPEMKIQETVVYMGQHGQVCIIVLLL